MQSLTGYVHEKVAASPSTKPYCHTLPAISQKLWPEFDRYLASRVLSPSVARKNLWYPSLHVDQLPRVVMPGTSQTAGNLYWQARLMEPLDPPYQAAVDTLRYESPHGVYRGDAIIVVWPSQPDNGLVAGYQGVVVEGPFDALAAADIGYIGVALMGVTPPDSVVSHIATFLRGAKCLVMGDRDQLNSMARVMHALTDLGLNCRLRSPYPYKDLAETPTRVARTAALCWEN